MMKYFTTALLVFAAFQTLAQAERNEFPNIINPNHRDEIFELIEFNMTPCDMSLIINKSDAPDADQDSIWANGVQNIFISNDTITIQTRIVDVCCTSFIADIQTDSLNNLNLTYDIYGEECFCTCCYGLEYVLRAKKPLPGEFNIRIKDKEVKYGPVRINQ